MPYPSRIMLPTGRAVVTATTKTYVVCGDPGPDRGDPDVEFVSDDFDLARAEHTRLNTEHPDVAWFVMRRTGTTQVQWTDEDRRRERNRLREEAEVARRIRNGEHPFPPRVHPAR